MEKLKTKNKSIWEVLYCINNFAFSVFVIADTDNFDIEIIVRNEFEAKGKKVSKIKLIASSLIELE